jgi:hypothetical protein
MMALCQTVDVFTVWEAEVVPGSIGTDHTLDSTLVVPGVELV